MFRSIQSHFPLAFLRDVPYFDRAERIYRDGTRRATSLVGVGTLIRPYVQAFYLNVRYDRDWYSPAYVALEVDGVRDASNEGLLFWNNSGRYDDIPMLRTGADRRLVSDRAGPAGTLLD